MNSTEAPNATEIEAQTARIAAGFKVATTRTGTDTHLIGSHDGRTTQRTNCGAIGQAIGEYSGIASVSCDRCRPLEVGR